MADAESSTILDISQQLDLLIVQYFQTLADVFKYKQLLENDVKDGFINMAKVTVLCFCTTVSVTRCIYRFFYNALLSIVKIQMSYTVTGQGCVVQTMDLHMEK